MFRLHHDRRGATVLEFAIIAPLFITTLLAIFSTAIGGFQQLVLDDAVRYAARQVQINGPASTSGANFVASVCSEFSLVAANCSTAITYNVQSNVPPALFASLTPVAMQASGNLANNFPIIASNSNVLIQVAYPLPLVVPYFTLVMTNTSTTSIMATTTVRTEPHS